MTILTAQVAQVKFPVEEGFIEGLMDERGGFYAGVSQLCKVFGTIPQNATRDFKVLLGHEYKFVKLKTPIHSQPINAVKLEDLQRLVISLASIGNVKAREILKVTKTPKTAKNKNKEKLIQVKLKQSLGGDMEVECLAGRIDLLTTTEIIEIKKVSDWKSGIGQVVVYSKYYPSHSRRLHLFGQTQESYLDMIRSHCDDNQILLTWEP